MNTHQLWIRVLTMSGFSERLKLLRSSRNMTQTRLAELLEIDPRVYNRWERGTATPQLDTVVKIADILQVSLDELAGRTEDISEPKIHNNELIIAEPNALIAFFLLLIALSVKLRSVKQ